MDSIQGSGFRAQGLNFRVQGADPTMTPSLASMDARVVLEAPPTPFSRVAARTV